jgi:hypothetical protein
MTDLNSSQPHSFDSFWPWMIHVGLRRFWDRWLLVHLVVGGVLAQFVPGKLSEFATNALIPLASILVGLTFAWSGNAVTLLQSTEVQRVGRADGGDRYRAYIFTYQGAVFIVLTLMTLWLLLAGKVVEAWQVTTIYWARMVGRTLTFAFSSLAMRECWHACVGVQQMLLMQVLVREAQSPQPSAPVVTAPPAVLPPAKASGTIGTPATSGSVAQLHQAPRRKKKHHRH